MSAVVIDGIEWPVEGAHVAIVQRGRVLLQFRPWPPGWELPGGHCEPGEDPAVTAARETEEEIGYQVRIAGVVGVFSWRGLRSASDVVFLDQVIGGAPRRSLEAWALRMTSPDALPRTVFPWMRERVRDAVDVSRWRSAGPPGATGHDPPRAPVRDGMAAYADRQVDRAPMITALVSWPA